MAIPELNHFGHVLPIQRRIQHLGKILADRHGPTAHVHVIFKLGQPEPLMSDIIDAPHRLDAKLEHPGKREPERNGEPGAEVAFTVAACDAIHGQHHHLNAGFLRALQHGPIETAVLVVVELIDLRSVMCLAQFFQAHRTEG